MRFLFCFLMLTSVSQASQNVVIVFDDSSSMTAIMPGSNLSRMDTAKNALKQVVGTLKSDTNLGIVLLNGRTKKWIVPFGLLNKNEAVSSIAQVVPNGRTPLGEAMKLGCDVLLEHRKKEHVGEYRLLIVTDGEANDPQLVESYLKDILVRGVVVDAIGVDMQANHSLATKVHHYRRGDSQKQLAEAIQASFAESNNQQDSAADFDIIKSIPEDAADVLLKSLRITNTPIGEQEVSVDPVPISNNIVPQRDDASVLCMGFLVAIILATFIIVICKFIVP